MKKKLFLLGSVGSHLRRISSHLGRIGSHLRRISSHLGRISSLGCRRISCFSVRAGVVTSGESGNSSYEQKLFHL